MKKGSLLMPQSLFEIRAIRPTSYSTWRQHGLNIRLPDTTCPFHLPFFEDHLRTRTGRLNTLCALNVVVWCRHSLQTTTPPLDMYFIMPVYTAPYCIKRTTSFLVECLSQTHIAVLLLVYHQKALVEVGRVQECDLKWHRKNFKAN